mmetsp:Transcript_22508/g.57126  ORF Transcript_22508/g.57126 Transcript_22508/m.57126 type:complete len:271 (-) Transcript_22508:109-921(-)
MGAAQAAIGQVRLVLVLAHHQCRRWRHRGVRLDGDAHAHVPALRRAAGLCGQARRGLAWRRVRVQVGHRRGGGRVRLRLPARRERHAPAGAHLALQLGGQAADHLRGRGDHAAPRRLGTLAQRRRHPRQRPRSDDHALGRRGRAERQQGGDGRAHQAHTHGACRQVHGGAHAAAQQGARDVVPARQAARGDGGAKGRGAAEHPRRPGHGRVGRADPELRAAPVQDGQGPAHGPRERAAAGCARRRHLPLRRGLAAVPTVRCGQEGRMIIS